MLRAKGIFDYELFSNSNINIQNFDENYLQKKYSTA